MHGGNNDTSMCIGAGSEFQGRKIDKFYFEKSSIFKFNKVYELVILFFAFIGNIAFWWGCTNYYFSYFWTNYFTLIIFHYLGYIFIISNTVPVPYNSWIYCICGILKIMLSIRLHKKHKNTLGHTLMTVSKLNKEKNA